jgi:DNA-directed RNA polymerase
MDDVLIGLNYLGQTAWRINEALLEVIEEAQSKNILIGEIPSAHDLPEPDRSTCYSTPQQIHERREAWRNNPRNAKTIEMADAAKEKQKIAESKLTEDELAAKAAKLAARMSNPNKRFHAKAPMQVLDLTSTEPVFDERMYADVVRRIKKKNSELHSLRCDIKIKLDIARQFRGQTMYYPHNLDFRGRAYPVPPNLSHLGSDFCRGLLLFAEKRPLGADGYTWLKIHLCNLFGNNKISMDDRQAWTESHTAEILDSAERPLEGNRWWTTFESPFQALACCKELKAVMECADPTQFLSNLPVHQDGSCNGLQHYAGLGRDSKGALAVNLIPSSTPQDVYTRVLEHVLTQIELDAQLPDLPDDNFKKLTLNHGKLARLVRGKVNRKVIKQTVMTSVYGVTATGARAQVQARLEEKYIEANPGKLMTTEVDQALFFAAHYVAGLTLKSLGQMFGSANSIMDWLGECSSLVSEQVCILISVFFYVKILTF